MDQRSSKLKVLENELVMDTLGSYLSIKDLGACRQVSKDWYKGTTPVFRKRAVVIKPGRYMGAVNDSAAAVYTTCDFGAHPFKKFVLGPRILGNGAALTKFWEVGAPVVTDLELRGLGYQRNVLRNKYGDIRMTSSIIPGKVAVVEKPTLGKLLGKGASSANLEQSGLEPNGAKTLSDVILRSTNLKILRLQRMLKTQWDNKTDCAYRDLEALWNLMLPVRKEDAAQFEVKVLDLLMASNDVALLKESFNLSLHALSFPLETLTLDIGELTKPTAIAQLLEPFKNSLRKLILFRSNHNYGPKPCKDFPFGIQFPNLKVFHVTAWFVGSMKFLEFMPKLQTLHVSCTTDKDEFVKGNFEPGDDFVEMVEVNDQRWKSGLRNTKMDMLTEFRTSRWTLPQAIPSLGGCMPNLRRITLPVIICGRLDEILESMLGQWKDLREVTLYVNRGVTSLTAHTMDQVKRLDTFSIHASKPGKCYIVNFRRDDDTPHVWALEPHDESDEYEEESS